MAQMDPKMREEMLEAASMAVAIAASEKAIAENQIPKKTPWKVPPPVVRAVVLVQACLRQKAFFRSFGVAAREDEELRALAPPDPLVAVALYMCRRMRNPRFVNVDTEAASVAGIVVAKDDVTMDVLANVVWFYEDIIAADHTAMITLRERLQGLVIHAHEVLQKKLEECQTPAEVQAEVEYSRKTFRVLPELAPEVFSCAEPRMKEVVHDAEKVIEREISKCITTLEYEQTAVELERLFGPVETQFREKLRVAHTRRVQFLERELETRWSRPFAGPLPPHSRASQRYVTELGMVPSVVAFLKEEKNHAAALEAQLEVELHEFQGILKNLAARRKEAKARSLIQDLEEKISDATVKLQKCIERALINLGPDNKKVCQKARYLLSLEAHTSVFAMFAETQAEELRTELEQNDPAPEAADRRRGIALSISAALDELNPEHVFQTELRGEFAEEIQAALASRSSPPTAFGNEVRPTSAEEPYGEPPVDALLTQPVDDKTRSPPQVPREAKEELRSAGEFGKATNTPTLPSEVESERHQPGRAWGTGPLGTSLSADVRGRDLPDDIRGNELPTGLRSPGEATVDEPEEEDLWLPPIGFEDLHSKDEKVQPPTKFLIPGTADGPPLQEKGLHVDQPSPETLMMMQSFDAESMKKATESINNGVTAQLVLQDLTMDVVHLHTEAVFKTKFRRAIADACGVPMDRVKILGFEHGSVKVVMTISEPLPDEQPAPSAERRRGAKQDGPKTAKEVLDDLTKQVADPSSRLRLGEVGPYITSAVVERGVASRSTPVEQHSLATAYMAPPLGTDKPGARTLAWTGTTEAGDTMGRTDGATMTWGNATGYHGTSMMPTMNETVQVLTEATSPPSPEMMQSSPMLKSASERTFRTTCPRDPLTHEDQSSSWASPYDPQPMYALYNKKPEEIHPRAFDGTELKTKPKKEKFTAHATFCVTRHPMCGTDKFKGLTVPQSPTIAAANSWLESADGELQEQGLTQADWPDLGDLAEKGRSLIGKDGTSEVGDIDDALSPQSTLTSTTEFGEGKKTGKKGGRKTGKKGTKSRDLQEPEPESQVSSPKASEAENDLDLSPTSPQVKKGTKKGGKKDKAVKDLTGDTSDVTEEGNDSTTEEGGKKKQKEQDKKRKTNKKADNLKPVFEEGVKDSGRGAIRSPRTDDKSDNEERSKKRGRLRPPAVDTQRGSNSSPTSPKTPVKTPGKVSQRPASEGSRELSAFNSVESGASNSRYAGMLGGIPNTGVRHQVDGESGTRLPELVGKPSTDDLRTPAFMYSWFRHSTVGVGPPYRTTEKDHEENPAWTAMKMLDESLDKNDWKRSYAWPSRKIGQAKQEWAFRGGQLGPERSIRQIQLGRSHSESDRDRLPPVNRRGGRQRPPRDHSKPVQQVTRPSPQPTSHITKPRPKTPEHDTPDVVITPADERPTSGDRPDSQGSKTGGTTVGDVIDVQDLPTQSEVTEQSKSESEQPKEQKPKDGKKKRERRELKQREEVPQETEEERQARLAAEEEKKAEAKAEQKRKAKEEKNKKAKEKLDKEKQDKKQHEKDEAERLQREKDDEERARVQAEEDKKSKDKQYEEKKKKAEEEAIKRNRDKKKHEIDLSDYDPHALDGVLDNARKDVLEHHGHLDVPENATSRSSSKNSSAKEKAKGKSSGKSKPKKKPKSKPDEKGPPQENKTEESRPGTGEIREATQSKTEEPISLMDLAEKVANSSLDDIEKALDTLSASNQEKLAAVFEQDKPVSLTDLAEKLANASLDDIEKALGTLSASSQAKLAAVLEPISLIDLAEYIANASLDDIEKALCTLSVNNQEKLAEVLEQDKPETPISLIDLAAKLANASLDDIEKALGTLSASSQAKLAAVLEQESGRPGEDELQNEQDEHIKREVAEALKESLASGELEALLLKKEDLPPISGTAVADVIDVTVPSTEVIKEKPKEEAPPPPAVAPEVEKPSLPSLTTDEVPRDLIEEKEVPETVGEVGTPIGLTIKLDFFGSEDLRPETRSPSMFSRMDTPTSCNTTLHNLGFGMSGSRPGTVINETTEMGVQTSEIGSRDPSKGTTVDVTMGVQAVGVQTSEIGSRDSSKRTVTTPPGDNVTDDKKPDDNVTDEANRVTVTVTPGPLGMAVHEDQVTKIKGGQAEEAGIKAGWRIVAVGNLKCKDFHDQTFLDGKNGTAPYQITFDTSEEATYRPASKQTPSDHANLSGDFRQLSPKAFGELHSKFEAPPKPTPEEKPVAPGGTAVVDAITVVEEKLDPPKSEPRELLDVPNMENLSGDFRLLSPQAFKDLHNQFKEEPPTGTPKSSRGSKANSRRPSQITVEDLPNMENLSGDFRQLSPKAFKDLHGQFKDTKPAQRETEPALIDNLPFPLSPSVGAWLRRAPSPVQRKLTERSQEASMETLTVPELADVLHFCHSPSVGAWLRAAPRGALSALRSLDEEPQRRETKPTVPPVAMGTAVADAIVDLPNMENLSGDFRKCLPRGLYDQFEAKKDKSKEPRDMSDLRGDFRPLSPKVLSDIHNQFQGERSSSSADRGTAVADVLEVEATNFRFPLSPSVGWLQSKPARAFLAAALDSLTTDVSEDTPSLKQHLFCPLPSSLLGSIHDRFRPKIEEAQDTPSPKQLSGDFRPLPSSLLGSIHDRFRPKIEEAQDDQNLKEIKSRVKEGLVSSYNNGTLDDAIRETKESMHMSQETKDTSPKQLSGDFRPLPSTLLGSIHDKFRPKIEEAQETPITKPRPGDFRTLPPSLLDRIYSRFTPKIEEPKIEERQLKIEEQQIPGVQEEVRERTRPEGRFRTNAGATREQVMNFAQSLTSSIFRNSNSIAMQRAASQPQLRRPVGLNSTMAPIGAPTPGLGGTIVAPVRSSSFSPPPPRGVNATSSRGNEGVPTAQAKARPYFQQRREPIPAEDGAFFD